MFDLILALITLPVFAAVSVCFRSWLIFDESRTMFAARELEAEMEAELEFIFSNDAEETCLDKNLLKFNYEGN